MPLLSVDNARLAEIRRAIKLGRPTSDGLIPAEGPHLLTEALRSAWRVQHVLCNRTARDRFAGLIEQVRTPVTVLSERAWKPLAGTEHSQGVLVLLEPREWRFAELLREPALLVVLDTLQDPGNVGAIARSAEAFGAGGLLLTEGCARVSNGKVLRAASGSLFRIPFLEGLSHAAIVKHLRDARLPLLVLSGRHQDAVPLSLSALRQPCALAVGNEGAGASPEWQIAEPTMIAVPTNRVESLNAAVACSIALFEAARQRAL